MAKEIVLLTGDVEGPHLAQALQEHEPGLKVCIVQTQDQVIDACSHPPSGERRLVAFCTSVIVPAGVLELLAGPAYNFHPGPPTYPGSHVASFAIYDGADRFGVTAHEMAPRVDSGPIVAVKWFDVPEDFRFADLEIRAYQAAAEMFRELAPRLATDFSPLLTLDVEWSGRRTTKKDFERMQQFDENMSEEEIKRRFRAFG